MIITIEKAKELTQYFTKDTERAKTIFALPLIDACRIINSDGYDYTVDELKEYVDYIRLSLLVEKGELKETELNEIFGGAGCVCLSPTICLEIGKLIPDTLLWLDYIN